MILSSPVDYPFTYNGPSDPADSVAQRRAPVEFLQKREEDRRVENWVKSQVASNAFMLTAARAYAQAQSASKAKSHSSKGHRRKRPFTSSSNRRSRSQDVYYEDVQLSYPYAGHLSTISELEEDTELEPYIFYSTPFPSSSSSSPIDSPISISSPLPISLPVTLAAPKPVYAYSYTPSPPDSPSPPTSPCTTYSTSTVTPWNNVKQHRRKSSCSSLSSSLSTSSLESIAEEE